MQDGFKKKVAMCQEIAETIIMKYICRLLTVDYLVEQLMQALCSEALDRPALEYLAHGLCIQAVREACASPDQVRRDQAFTFLHDYLKGALECMSGFNELRFKGLDEEIVQQALIEIWDTLHRRKSGPTEPAAFLKWARTLLVYQKADVQRTSWRKNKVCDSLDELTEEVLEALPDKQAADPMNVVLNTEKFAELRQMVMALKNPQYRQVLLSIGFDGLEEKDLASRLHVPVKDIYLWHCRAIRALCKQRQTMSKGV